jgi:hypothetical protein
MSKDLVLFSGGLDSSYLAYKLLSDTSNEITLLSVVTDCGMAGGLFGGQVLQMQPLIAELKKIRSFKMKYLYAGKNEITSHHLDWWNIYPMHRFAEDFNNGKYDRLVSGSNWEMLDGSFHKHSNPEIQQAKHIAGPKVFASLTQRGELWNPLVTHDFYQNFNRWHALKHTPENIRSKISCGSGIEENQCNLCDKCLFTNKVSKMMKSGATASDVDDWRRSKSHEYTESTTRDCSWRWWIHLEENKEAGFYPFLEKGLAEDVPPDLKITFPIKTKEEFIKWYSTIEYSPVIDAWLKKWGLTKNDWTPGS